MRDYAKVMSSFWTGKTGREIRGEHDTQIVAMYLMTCRHANMIGLFHCPTVYISHETGCSLEGASKALARLEELGFCTFDEDSETIWVYEMARHQIGEALSPNDKQVKGIQKQYEALPESRMKYGFFERYAADFHLTEAKTHGRGLEGPPKPGTGTGTGEKVVNPDGLDEIPFAENKEIQDAVRLYNDMAATMGLPVVFKVTPQRKAAIRRRLKDSGGLDGWKNALVKLSKTPFCCGENDKGWRADLDFLCQQKSFVKLLEGGYDQHAPRRTPQPPRIGSL